MKHILFFSTLLILVFSSCRWMGYKQVKGNGNLGSENRNITRAEKIKLAGSYNIEVMQGPVTSVKVEADENIIPYILTQEEDGFLIIKSKPHVNFSTEHAIKIYITTNKLEQVQIAGSGNVIGKNQFTGGNKMILKISGSGDIQLDVNAPDISAEIAGSGSILLKGETKNETIHISGVGDYKADELKAENAKVKIAGSGNVKIFADVNLDISIAGVGSVYYKGAAAVKQHIAGSGEVKKLE